jgi:hexosaminidase
MRLFLSVLLLCFVILGNTQAKLSIIPIPNKIQIYEGSVDLSHLQGVITIGENLDFETEYLEKQLIKHFNFEFKYTNKKTLKKYVLLRITPLLDSSSYELRIFNNQIIIESGSKTGIFYGIQTLIQIINSTGINNLPFLAIKDSPRFQWRGMHLDCSRHFFSVEEIKKYLDYLAIYKMNTFHWHLTDDQGWRIEIKKYPKLTEIGAWRNGTMVGAYSNHEFDTIRYGGYYTQDQIVEIVKYASQRHITVVPEIEMPGHSLAVLAAYPHLACRDSIFEVGKMWGVFDDVLCAGNEDVFRFLEDVLDEVLELFPSQYIHIGGDECPKTRWKTCPSCQQRILDNQLHDEHHLQSYFIQRIEKYLNSKGRKIIGWDEILEGGLAPNAAVMSWRGEEGGIAAAKAGHFAVMTPGKPCYFDHYQVADKSTEPHAIGGLNTLKDVYLYEPIPKALTPEESFYILGSQGNMWSEYFLSFSYVEYMALPRMAALAESLWSLPQQKNYMDFISRLKINTLILDRMNANYSKHFLNE